MATLLGTKIKDTYNGLLKLIDNAGLTATNKSITDGEGNETGLKLGTGATVEITKKVSQTGLGKSTYFGEEAGIVDDLSDNENTGFGFNSLKSMIIGNKHTAIGYRALMVNTRYSNTAIGNDSLKANTTGSRNTAVGQGSLNISTSSSYNTAIGESALAYITTGENNTAVGSIAGSIAVGGGANTTGQKSVYIGKDTKAAAVGETNQIVIGHEAEGNGSNTATIGDENVTALHLMKPGATLSLKSLDGTDYDMSVSNAGVFGAAGVPPSGGGGSSIRQWLNGVSLSTTGTWQAWSGARNMLTDSPNWQSGNGAEPTNINNHNRFYLKGKGSLTSLQFSAQKMQNAGTIEIYAVSYDYAGNRSTLANKQILINETFTGVGNESFAKTNFTIAANTLSDESILIVSLRCTVGTESISSPSLEWGFAS